MRRFALLMAAAVLAATTAPALATTKAPRPQIHDVAGDWVVASQDILDGTITATAKQLRADVHLSAPPAIGVRTDYDVIMWVGCLPYSLHYTWNGGAAGSTATLDVYSCGSGDQAKDLPAGLKPTTSYPATATVTATGLRIAAAPLASLHRGVVVDAGATARVFEVIVGVGLSSTSPSFGGDIAGGGEFALGS
jgi:hypothetical protein